MTPQGGTREGCGAPKESKLSEWSLLLSSFCSLFLPSFLFLWMLIKNYSTCTRAEIWAKLCRRQMPSSPSGEKDRFCFIWALFKEVRSGFLPSRSLPQWANLTSSNTLYTDPGLLPDLNTGCSTHAVWPWISWFSKSGAPYPWKEDDASYLTGWLWETEQANGKSPLVDGLPFSVLQGRVLYFETREWISVARKSFREF